MLEKIKEMLENLDRFSLAHAGVFPYMANCKDGEYVDHEDLLEIIKFIDEEIKKDKK